MAFLDDLGKKISSAAQTTVQKSKELADNAKNSMAISGEEKEIDRCYKELGAWYYKTHKDAPDEEAAAVVQAITQSMDKIESLRAEMERDDRPKIVEEDAAEYKFCPRCGNKLKKEARFCGECGAKLEEPTAE